MATKTDVRLANTKTQQTTKTGTNHQANPASTRAWGFVMPPTILKPDGTNLSQSTRHAVLGFPDPDSPVLDAADNNGGGATDADAGSAGNEGTKIPPPVIRRGRF